MRIFHTSCKKKCDLDALTTQSLHEILDNDDFKVVFL